MPELVFWESRSHRVFPCPLLATPVHRRWIMSTDGGLLLEPSVPHTTYGHVPGIMCLNRKALKHQSIYTKERPFRDSELPTATRYSRNALPSRLVFASPKTPRLFFWGNQCSSLIKEPSRDPISRHVFLWGTAHVIYPRGRPVCTALAPLEKTQEPREAEKTTIRHSSTRSE